MILFGLILAPLLLSSFFSIHPAYSILAGNTKSQKIAYEFRKHRATPEIIKTLLSDYPCISLSLVSSRLDWMRADEDVSGRKAPSPPPLEICEGASEVLWLVCWTAIVGNPGSNLSSAMKLPE